jgi:endonuclease/exonuclease/phosphatase family metal-dependent hydrolase
MVRTMPSVLHRLLRTVLALGAIAATHRAVRGPLALALERPVPVSIPDKGDRLRIVTWNVRNFPDESEASHLAERLERLDADVVAFQELRDPVAAAALVPRHALHVSRGGGRGGQHVALAFDDTVLERLAGPFEHTSLTMDGRVRPALSMRLRHRDAGITFDVMVVHLKATPRGHTLRRAQWAHLRAIAETKGDEIPLVVLGDFNVTGPPGGSSELELAALDRHLGRVGLRRLEAGPCTAYWEGARHDAWKEPSLLDLVWVRSARGWKDLRAHAWGPCARYACQPFRSTPAYPDSDLLRGSDHCPVSVDVPLERRRTSPLQSPT